MSDTPQGPDWWQASDDRWYPPPRPEMPGDAAAVAAPATPGSAPSDAAPPAGPAAAPTGAAPPGAAPPATAPGAVPPGTGPAEPPPPPPFPPPGAPSVPPVGPAGPPPGTYPQGPPSGGYPTRPPFAPPPGPYGAPSGAQPPGAPRQNRTPLYIAIGVVGAAALLGAILLVANGGDDDSASPGVGTIATDDTAAAGGSGAAGTGDPSAATGSAPSSGVAVEVVDKGFSNFMSGFDQDQRTASYGFILENTGDETAVDVRINVSAFDADGAALASASHSVYVLRPGQRMGLGDELYGENLPSEVASLQVQVSEPSDFPNQVPDDGVLTAEGASTSTDDYGITTTFTVRSTFTQQIDSPYAYAVYRNAEGKIIGGAYDILDFVPAEGTAAGDVQSYEVIPGVDSAEVYIDPGYIG